MKQEIKHRIRGEDPNEMEVVLSDVKESFDETMMMLEEMVKKEGLSMEELSKEPPNWKERESLHDHALNVKVRHWMEKVLDFIKESYLRSANWLNTESGEDICWYHTILPVKTDRQITNRWEIDNEDDDGCDHQYTHWVLEEVIETLGRAFSELLSSNDTSYEEKVSFRQLSDELQSLEKDILSI